MELLEFFLSPPPSRWLMGRIERTALAHWIRHEHLLKLLETSMNKVICKREALLGRVVVIHSLLRDWICLSATFHIALFFLSFHIGGGCWKRRSLIIKWRRQRAGRRKNTRKHPFVSSRHRTSFPIAAIASSTLLLQSSEPRTFSLTYSGLKSHSFFIT